MRRREFIATLGSAATWPLVALAQQPGKITRVGILWHAGGEEEKVVLTPFHRELTKLEWPENRYGSDDVLVATTAEGALAAEPATTAVRIVFVVAGDPVLLNLVEAHQTAGPVP